MSNRVGNIIFRYVVASVGLFMIAFAIALAIKSNLGTAPLSCVAYVLNLDIPGISVGAFTFLVNMVYILVQLAVLRKRFKLVSLMQVVASVVFGYMIDASLWMLGWLEPAGFGRLSVTTAEEHDRMIAFTSQMAHIVSNAYIKSPTAGSHKGFSAGSYKDLTRVARLNPKMWAELFMDNRENVIKEIDWMVGFLNEYKDAIINDDEERLVRILDEGSKKKIALDG